MEASRLEELYQDAPERAPLTTEDVIEEAKERLRTTIEEAAEAVGGYDPASLYRPLFSERN
jgi:hypothetical protein